MHMSLQQTPAAVPWSVTEQSLGHDDTRQEPRTHERPHESPEATQSEAVKHGEPGGLVDDGGAGSRLNEYATAVDADVVNPERKPRAVTVTVTVDR